MVACHFIYSVLMIFSLRVRRWLLNEQRRCVSVRFRQITLLNVKLADWQDIWTATVPFALSGTQQKALCMAKEAIWSVCLKMPCQIFWCVCACVWLNLTVTFGLFFSCIYSVSFIIKPSPFVCISLTLEKESQSSPVFLCTSLGFLMAPAALLLLFSIEV